MAAVVQASIDPEERPLPVVALVGNQSYHAALTSRKPSSADELQPRYLSLPVDTRQLDHTPGSGEEHSNLVLKRDWLHKHTYVVAAVVSLWFSWDAETPVSSIVSTMEAFRARCRPSCKIVLVLVQRGGAAAAGPFGPLASPLKDDERLSALRRQADLDSKHVLSLVHVEGEGDSARLDESTVRRVERSLLELALSYYKDESRGNKKAKQTHAGVRTQPHLVARHHFKRAYYSEVRRDTPSAAKHWLACAAALRDLLRGVVAPTSDTERSQVQLGEVKRVAEFVNRKITLGAFASGRASDACDAFRKHIRLFRPLAHPPALANPSPGGGATSSSAAAVAAAGHIHWGWLCKQYRVRLPQPSPPHSPHLPTAHRYVLHPTAPSSPPPPSARSPPRTHPQRPPTPSHSHALSRVRAAQSFAKALEAASASAGGSSAAAASRLGTSGGGAHSQYTECGYYYQAAATCALERRKCAEQLLASLAPVTSTSVATSAAATAAGPLATLPPTLVLEGKPAAQLAAMLGLGSQVSVAADSATLIELLTRAYEHFKQSRQLRMILFLASQMAEEYFYAKDYQMAKRFFERVAKTYQKEQWYQVPLPAPPPATHAASTAVTSAPTAVTSAPTPLTPRWRPSRRACRRCSPTSSAAYASVRSSSTC